MLRHLDRERFDVVAGRHHPRRRMGARHRRPRAARDPTAGSCRRSTPRPPRVALPGDPTRGGLVVLEPGRAGEVLGGVDVVFPVLHGPFGEDGTIQGLLEMAGLPYVGAGVLASAAGMDKEFTKKLLAADGLPVGDLVVLRPGTATLTAAQRERLGLPVFVKPARAGSSVGITRVTDWADARRRDRRGPRARPEGAGRGGDRRPRGRVRRAGAPRRDAAGEPARRDPDRRRRRPFYDFDAKYLDDVCEFDIPAKLDDDVTERVREPRSRRSAPWTARGSRASTSSSGRTACRWSTRSTRCRASRRSRCTRGCGR